MKHWNPATATAANDVLDINEHRLMSRLRKVLSPFEIAKRTPAAEVVHAALIADQRASGQSSAALSALTHDQLVDAYCEVSWALEQGSTLPCALPFGTKATSGTKGSLQIGSQTYVLDAGRPGLHRVEMVPRHAHGPNLELLTASILRKTRKLACRKLGAPIPVHVVEVDSRHLIQFAPLPEAGGVILQRGVYETGADRFCSALPEQIEAFAKSIVADMRVLWNRRKEIGARVELVRAAAEAGLPGGIHAHGRNKVKAITVDLSMLHDYPISLGIEYEALDEAMRPGTVIDFVPAYVGLDERAWRAPRALEQRWGVRDRLTALGATGLIDEMAEAVIKAAPDGAALLRRLGNCHELTTVLQTSSGPLYATLFWRDGVINVEMSSPGLLEYYYGRLELGGIEMTDELMETLPGQPVADHFVLPFETAAKISGVDIAAVDAVRLRIDPAEKLVNIETGAIWEVAGVDSLSLILG